MAMTARLLACLALTVSFWFAAAWGTAEVVRPTERPFLYRIEGKSPSFLYGTVHMPHARVLALPRSVRLAHRKASAVITEVPLDAETQARVQKAALLPAGKTFSQIVPTDLRERTAAYLATRSIPLHAVESQKVWAVAVSLPLLDFLEMMATQPTLDQYLFRQAIQQRKQVDALETPEEQIAIMDGIGEQGQISLLRQTLDYLEAVEPGAPGPIDRLLQAYLEGDPDELVRVSFEYADMEDPVTREFVDAMLHERNERMAKRIDERLKGHQGDVQFFAIGALHVPGPDGVKARLEKAGYTLTRVAGNETP
jgi:uncharacterized protein YbaP (TraB family)